MDQWKGGSVTQLSDMWEVLTVARYSLLAFAIYGIALSFLIAGAREMLDKRKKRREQKRRSLETRQ